MKLKTCILQECYLNIHVVLASSNCSYNEVRVYCVIVLFINIAPNVLFSGGVLVTCRAGGRSLFSGSIDGTIVQWTPGFVVNKEIEVRSTQHAVAFHCGLHIVDVQRFRESISYSGF